MTIQFDEAGRGDARRPQVTPFSMNRWLVPPASTDGPPRAAGLQVETPPVEVRIGPEDITLVAEMPGIRREDIDISVLPGAIKILGEPADDAQPADSGGKYEQGMPNAGRIRLFTGTAPPPGARARLINGVLELRLPRRMVLQGRMSARIPVG